MLNQSLSTPPTDLGKLKNLLAPREYDELLNLLHEQAAKTLFIPTPKQLEVVNSPADIVGYGGAAGGGKSFLITGLAVAHHKRSAIVRPQKNQTQKFVLELAKMLGGRDGYNSSTSSWNFTTPDGVERFVKFFGLDNPGDEEKQQGDDYDLKCVGAGTLVWMADGSKRVIETLTPGDMVDTLEGPRRVTRVIRTERPGVKISFPGRSAQGQVQAASHRFLGPRGWRSVEGDADHPASTGRGFSFATSTCGESIFAGSLSRTSAAVQPLRDTRQQGRQQRLVSAQGREDRQFASDFVVDEVCTTPGSDGESHCGPRPTSAPHLSLSLPEATRREAEPRRSGCAEDHPALESGALGAQRQSSLRGSREHCSIGRYRDGERPHLSATDVRPGLRQPVGAAPRIPIYLLEDEGRQTPRHSHRKWSWPHPYRKETRSTDRPARVVEVEYCDVGVVPLFDLTVEGANHYITQQGIVNSNCYDEVTQMREEDIRYTLTWNRTDDPTQRVRAVLAFNPPTTPEGRWVIKYFAPWLDPAHPRPAKDGEIRYFATVGNDRDYEVQSAQRFVILRVRGVEMPYYRFDPALYSPEQIITPESRTFIHAKVTDNPYYMKTNYLQKLQSLPEPLRSQMMNGDFFAGMEDDARQVIPTRWIMEAQARWRERDALIRSGAAPLPPQDSLGVDVARGGNMGGDEVSIGSDELVVSPRHGTWFAEQQVHKGIDINDGSKAAALILAARRDEAPIHIDVVGVGTSPYDFLRTNNIHVIAINGSTSDVGIDASGLLRFANKRAAIHWRMREALDPLSPEPLAIPPDPQLLSDLAAPRWSLTKTGIQIELKDDIKKRLGRSPDRGEALMLANIDTPKRMMILGAYRDAPRANQLNYEQRRLKELEDGY